MPLTLRAADMSLTTPENPYMPLVRTRAWFARLAAGLLLCLVVSAGYLGYLRLTGNFNTVIEGEVYRSAQPTPAMLKSYMARYHIRSVINLRGANPGRPWYDAEVSAASELGLAHVDFRISARKELSKDQVMRLIEIMKTAPKPMLIHCQAGADRSGLASALYVAAVAGQGEAAAERQLSLLFGHLPLPFIAEAAMDRTFEAMEPVLDFIRS
ncbi:fused DSP-PTPase phosphatase/NAD kinase-like protein [Allorhizobium undicola]|uniref:fused DSP-PTPase phosphatase/NAD kinase-like protein n=1 Tax=Allorhizobium undicola TaxID=78527 RepID=UPI003D338E18